MNVERRYRGGRSPARSRDDPPMDWKLSPYRRRGAEEYSGGARIERRDHFDDRLSRFPEYEGRDRDNIYEDGGRRIEEKLNFDRAVSLSDYGDGAKGKYDNKVSVGVSRRSYNDDSYRGDWSSMKSKWDHPFDESRKSEHLSFKDNSFTRGSSGVGDINVTSSGDIGYYPQNHYLDSGRAGLPVSRYLDSTVPVSLKYENGGKMHSDSYTLARGGVDDLPVSNLSGGDGGSHTSYVAPEYTVTDSNRKRYFHSRDEPQLERREGLIDRQDNFFEKKSGGLHFRDEPHLERRDGLNDRQDKFFEKKSGGLHFQDRYLGVEATSDSQMYKFKKEDSLLSSRGYLKGDSDYRISSSQHKDYDPMPLGISREGFSCYSPTRDLHMPSSDVIQRGSRLASQPIRFDGYCENKQSMPLTEPGGQLQDKRSSSHLYVGLPEDRQGDWAYAEFARSKIDSTCTRVNDIEEDYRDQHISRFDKHKVDARSRKEHMEDDGLWNPYSFQEQSPSDKSDVHGPLHLRREDVDNLGTGSTRLNYGAETYYGRRCVETENHHANVDDRQWSHYENSDFLQSREYDHMRDRLYDSPRKRLPMVDLGLDESGERRLRNKYVGDEMLYDHDVGIRISADGNGGRRIYNQVDMEDEIDFQHFSKKPKSSRPDYKKTWRESSLGNDEPFYSQFHPHYSTEPKSNSRDIRNRLGPTPKLHVSQRLVMKYKPSIKKRLAPPPSKKHTTLPWLKNASSSTMSSEQNHSNDPNVGVRDHDGNHLGDQHPQAKPEPPEKSEDFKQLVQSAFFKFLKQINETPIKRKKFTEQEKDGILKCFVCGSNSKEFVRTESLAMHAFTCKTVGMRSQHLGLHKALCALMGWKYAEHTSSAWHHEVMTDAETQAVKEDLIIWPPLVVVHNSSVDSINQGERVIISAEKLDTKLRDMGFKSILKVCSGKPANQSVMLVKFNGTLSGLREAERFHKHFMKSKHGRVDFKQLKIESESSSGKTAVSSEREDDFLYGYLGIAEDLDKLDFDTKKRCVIRSKKQIHSIVDVPIDTEGKTGR